MEMVPASIKESEETMKANHFFFDNNKLNAILNISFSHLIQLSVLHAVKVVRVRK